MGISRKSGFTIVELLIVIVIIGILAAIVIVAYSGITSRAQTSKASADLHNIKQAINRLELDTGSTVFGCGTTVYGPEGTVQAAATGLVSTPSIGVDNEGCSWTSGVTSTWRGPYFPSTLDPWGRDYYIDLDYYICDAGTAKLIAAVVSKGKDGSLQYPSSTTSGACTTGSSDDIYQELRRP